MEKYYIITIYTIAVVLLTLFVWGHIRICRLKKYINNECVLGNRHKVYSMALDFIYNKTKCILLLFISGTAVYLGFSYFIRNKSFYAFILGELFIVTSSVLSYLNIAIFCNKFYDCCKYIDKMNNMFEKTNFKINE